MPGTSVLGARPRDVILELPLEPFAGPYPVACPKEISREARAYWKAWATSGFAYHFIVPDWHCLALTTRLMDDYFTNGHMQALVEARHRENNLFGLGFRLRMHIDKAKPPEAEKPKAAGRSDPRLKLVVNE